MQLAGQNLNVEITKKLKKHKNNSASAAVRNGISVNSHVELENIDNPSSDGISFEA